MKRILLIIILLIIAIGCGEKTTDKTDSSTEDSLTYLDEGVKAINQAEYDDALIHLHKAYAEDNNRWEIYYYYGLTAGKLNNVPVADQYFNLALSHTSEDKNCSDIYTAWGNLYQQNNQTDKANTFYEEASKLSSDTN